MELVDYLGVIRKNILIVLVCAIVFGGLGFYLTASQPATYQSSLAMEVSKEPSLEQAEVSYYQYDNYYNVQVAASFSDNLIGWLAAPSTVSEIFDRTGYDLPRVDLRDLGRIFTTKKKIATSSVIDISYESDDPEKAEALVQTAASVLKDKVEQYNRSTSSSNFIISPSSPVVIAAPKSTTVNTTIALLVGIFISTGIAFAREPLKK